MREVLVMLAAVTALLSQQSDTTKEDLKKLQGQWTVKTMRFDGKDAKIDNASSTWTIKDNKITSDTHPSHMVFQLDAGKSPKIMDGHHFIFKEMSAFKAIYAIEGHTLTLCFDPTGKVYPSSFESKAGSGFNLITLTRAK